MEPLNILAPLGGQVPPKVFSKVVHLPICQKLAAFLNAARQDALKGDYLSEKMVLALDPGETTGVAYIDPEANKIVILQWDTGPNRLGESFAEFLNILVENPIASVRYEDYRVYQWKAGDHAWAALHTPQWIGAIKVGCHYARVPATGKLAQQAKTFWTDQKLKTFNMYEPGLKHARDALRHLLYYLCFPKV